MRRRALKYSNPIPNRTLGITLGMAAHVDRKSRFYNILTWQISYTPMMHIHIMKKNLGNSLVLCHFPVLTPTSENSPVAVQRTEALSYCPHTLPHNTFFSAFLRGYLYLEVSGVCVCMCVCARMHARVWCMCVCMCVCACVCNHQHNCLFLCTT